ncbi:DUF447 domain-containing protein [Rivibacter subsaxonicus]
MIFETVVTTLAADGTPHVAPFGVRYSEGRVLLKPFKPSATLDNIRASGHAVLNLTTDVRVFAGAVTARWLGPRSWSLLPVATIAGVRLAQALSHVVLALEHDDDHDERPTLTLRRVHEEQHLPFAGFNRAQAAVIEGAVLVSRLHMLQTEKIDAEMAYLQIAIDKTAGDAERQAFGWLQQAVAAHRAAAR